jgi:protein-disulfide isomerase
MENSIRPWYKHWRSIVVIIFSVIILFFLTVCAIYFIKEIKNAKLNFNKTGQGLSSLPARSGQKYDAASGEHYWLGSANGEVTIVEFGDFACPVCGQAFATVGELRSKYKNEVKFIWRDYPVVTDYSATLALAARCAGEQGLFWPMHDKLFQNQSINQTDQLIALANQISADTVKFQDCLGKQKYLPSIQKDLADGQSFGVNGTPAYFINGYKIEGDVPYETFVKIIEELKK